MPYISDGSNDEVRGKGNLLKRASNFIDSIKSTISIGKLRLNSYSERESIESIIGKAYLALKDISNVNTVSKINLKKHGHSIVPNNFDDMENINKYYFFISMLGFIDANIIECDKLINYHSKFMDTDENSAEGYFRYRNIKVKMLFERQDVISALKSINILGKIDPIMELIPKEFLSHVPLSEHYDELKKWVTDLNSDSLYHFMDAYNSGFRADSSSYDEAMINYRELYNKLRQHINKNKQKVRMKTK